MEGIIPKKTRRNMENQQEERKVKLIWEFHGPDAARTAEHHALHLKEFIKTNDIKLNITGFETLGKNHSMAYMVIYEGRLQETREALKPHRGQIYEEKN